MSGFRGSAGGGTARFSATEAAIIRTLVSQITELVQTDQAPPGPGGLTPGEAGAHGPGSPDDLAEMLSQLDRPATPPEDPVLAAMRRMPKDGRNREALYRDGYHMLLRDLHAKHIWRDIAAWIENPHAPLPSGADALDRIDAAVEAHLRYCLEISD